MRSTLQHQVVRCTDVHVLPQRHKDEKDEKDETEGWYVLRSESVFNCYISLRCVDNCSPANASPKHKLNI